MIALGGEQETTPLSPAGSECHSLKGIITDLSIPRDYAEAPLWLWIRTTRFFGSLVITDIQTRSPSETFFVNRSPELSLRVRTTADAIEERRNPQLEKIQFTHWISELVGNLQCIPHDAEKHLVHITTLSSCTLEAFLSDPLGRLLGSSPSPQPTWKTTA